MTPWYFPQHHCLYSPIQKKIGWKKTLRVRKSFLELLYQRILNLSELVAIIYFWKPIKISKENTIQSLLLILLLLFYRLYSNFLINTHEGPFEKKSLFYGLIPLGTLRNNCCLSAKIVETLEIYVFNKYIPRPS